MNLKKFISGISALTIAASAFAGMAVTASAAEPAYSQNFGNTEGLTQKTFNVYSNSSTYSEVNGYDPSDFGFTRTSDIATNAGGHSTAYVDTEGKFVIVANADKNTRGLSYAATLDSAIGSGNIAYVSFDWSMGAGTGNTSSYSGIYLSDTSGKKILDIKRYGSAYKLTVNDTQVASTDNKNHDVTVTATLDMNTKKITALSIGDMYTLPSGEDIDFANAEAASIAKFGFVHCTGAVNWANTSWVDNISITYEEAKVAVSSINVLYKYNGQTVKTVPVSAAGLYVGDSYTYFSSNYVDVDGTYYVVGDDYVTDGANTYSTNDSNKNGAVRTITTLSANTEIVYNITDTSSGKIVYFGEGKDVLNSNAHSTAHNDSRYIASGGTVEYENTYASGIKFYDVTETGQYQITIAIAAGAGRGEAIFTSSEAAEAVTTYDGVTAENSVISGSANNIRNGYSVVKTATLNSGDELRIKGFGNNTRYWTTDNIDYVVVRKLTNTVNVANTTNGTVTSNVEYAKPGDTVTLTVTPDANYALDSITGVNSTKVNDTTYTFIMPAEAVTVSATFKSTVVEPSVSISGVDSTTTEYKGGTFTLAKLLVDVVGSVNAINVTYKANGATQKATDMTAITNGTIVLGAIVADNVTVDLNTFSVDVATAE